MFSDEEQSPIDAEEKKRGIIADAAQYRDQLFEGNQGKVVKVVGGTAVAMYIIYRFLFSK